MFFHMSNYAEVTHISVDNHLVIRLIGYSRNESKGKLLESLSVDSGTEENQNPTTQIVNYAPHEQDYHFQLNFHANRN